MAIVCTDIDGNEYQTVTIGDYIWTTESLRVTKYNDGTSIPLVSGTGDWTSASDAYCFMNNSTDVAQNTKYGALYNWYAVNTGKLAPFGWHVPSYNEMVAFAVYMVANGYNYDGTSADNKIGKSLASQSEWKNSVVSGAIGNVVSTNNSSNFNMYPAGTRVPTTGAFAELSGTGYIWSTKQSDATKANFWYLYYNTVLFSNTNNLKGYGFSIRLLKNNYNGYQRNWLKMKHMGKL